jgi:hypothetical protein
MQLNARPQLWILRQLLGDARGIGAQIENAADAFYRLGHYRIAAQLEIDKQSRFRFVRLGAEEASCAIDFDCALI